MFAVYVPSALNSVLHSLAKTIGMLLGFLLALAFGDSGTGCIMGGARYDSCGIPHVTVSIEGTEMSAVTDSNGMYNFTGLPGGNYTVSFRREHPRIRGERENVQVVPGDTTFADGQFTHFSRYSLRQVEDDRHVLLRFVSREDRSLDGLVAYSDKHRLRVERIERDLYSVSVPLDVSKILWSLPFLGEQTADVRDCPATRRGPVELEASKGVQPPWNAPMHLFDGTDMERYPLAIADSTIDEWMNPEWKIDHHCMDMTSVFAFQDSSSSYLTSSAAIDEDNSWRFTAVFTDHLVSISGRLELCSRRIQPPADRAWISSHSDHLVVRCPSGIDHSYNIWLVVNATTGETVQFDPFPELDPFMEPDYFRRTSVEYAPYSEMAIRPRRRFYLLPGNCIIGEYDMEVRTYTEDGSQQLVQYYQDMAIDDSYWVKFDVASRRGRWALLHAATENKLLLMGDCYEFDRINIDTLSIDRHTDIRLLPDGRRLLLTSRAGGLSLYDTDTGALGNLLTSDIVHDIVFSANGELMIATARARGDSIGDFTSRLFDTAGQVEEIVSYPAYSLHWFYMEPLALSDSGHLLAMVHERPHWHYGHGRMVLLDASGKVIWLGNRVAPNKYSEYETWCTISDDGRLCIFCDGYLIHLLKVEQAL